MKTNRRKFVKTGLTSVAGVALAGKTFGLWHAELPVPKVFELSKLDGNNWLIAADPDNIGKNEEWQRAPLPNAKPATVPKISQFALPGYHGVIWYWCDMSLPDRPEKYSRYLLRFLAVFYKADVYVNGQLVGAHEGGETPFTLDITEFARPGQKNLLAVRVLDPHHERVIDGIKLSQVPHRVYSPTYIPTPGGIIDSVELLIRPAIYVSDLFVRPDWKTGQVDIDTEIVNTLDRSVSGRLELGITLDDNTASLDHTVESSKLSKGISHIHSTLKVPDWRLWDLDHPTLYRVTSRLTGRAAGDKPDVCSVPCGFRDFRVENGYFRLNGKRIYVRSGHTANHAPVGIYTPCDHGTKPDLIQRGMLEAKRLGFNMVRFLGSIPRRNVVDYCDEIGLLLYVESMASWGWNPKTDEEKERFNSSIREMVLRDRNSPSVVVWGILNETHYDNGCYELAKNCLPLLREYDSTRFVMLSSGRWDKELGVGSGSNSGSTEWNVFLGDEHPGGKIGDEGVGDVHRYLPVPHSTDSISWLRNLGKGWRNGVFLKEYGVGSGQHLPKIMELHRKHNGQQMEIYKWFSRMNDLYMTDWKEWQLNEMYSNPDSFFEASLAAMAPQRLIGINAVRANPYLIGHNVTSLVDIPNSGEGVIDSMRLPKAGVYEVMRNVFAPLRLCLFVEPYYIYRGSQIQIEAVLANEDVLRSGSYQAELSIVDKADTIVWHKTVALAVPEGEAPLAIPFFSGNVVTDWPAGKYRFRAKLQGRTDVTGGEAVFYVGDKANMPAVNELITLWGRDENLRKWLESGGIKTTLYSDNIPTRRELILVGSDRPANFTVESFAELVRRVTRGSTVVFLNHLAWTTEDATKGASERTILWPPLMQEERARLRSLRMWLYLADHWAKSHPVFNGMPAGGMLDHVFYREIIGSWALTEPPKPAQAIAGAVDTSFARGGPNADYHSGLTLAEYKLGLGRFFINTLQICDNLGKVPSAELLLRNMLNYAARDMNKPLMG